MEQLSRHPRNFNTEGLLRLVLAYVLVILLLFAALYDRTIEVFMLYMLAGYTRYFWLGKARASKQRSASTARGPSEDYLRVFMANPRAPRIKTD